MGDIETRTLPLDYADLMETPTLKNSAGDLIASEPSLHNPRKEVGQFSGWTLDQSNPSGTAILNFYLQDGTKGTLSDGVQRADNYFLSFSGTATEAQALLNQLTFTATDRELDNQTDATGVASMTQRIIKRPGHRQ